MRGLLWEVEPFRKRYSSLSREGASRVDTTGRLLRGYPMHQDKDLHRWIWRGSPELKSTSRTEQTSVLRLYSGLPLRMTSRGNGALLSRQARMYAPALLISAQLSRNLKRSTNSSSSMIVDHSSLSLTMTLCQCLQTNSAWRS